jgi:hypothetical protein
MEPSWSELFAAFAKLATAAGLFAYLLHLGGLRPMAISLLTIAHVMSLCCLLPISAELGGFGVLILGTCTYAVLAVDRPRLRASVVILCHLVLVSTALPDIPALGLVIASPLALWTGLMVTIKAWARKNPAELRKVG